MVSTIDVTVPEYGTPDTASVRANFQVANNEITALQSAMTAAQGSITTLQSQVVNLTNATVGAPFLPTGGGTMSGPFLVTAASGPVVITQNAVIPADISGTTWQLALVGGDGVPLNVLNDTYGGESGVTFRRAEGTSVSPQPTLFPTNIMCLDAMGYGGTSYALAARINAQTAEAWTDAADGTQMFFNTTINGTLTMPARLQVLNDGTILMGNAAVVGTDKVQVNNYLRTDQLRIGNLATGPTLTSGVGAPTATQPVSSLYMRTDGTAGNRLYVNQARNEHLASRGGRLMPSAIDPTVPISGGATTPSVRDNFNVAKAEITALQAAMLQAQSDITTLQGTVGGLSATFAGGPYMPLSGGSLRGPLRNPGRTSPVVMTRSVAVQPALIPSDTVLAFAGQDAGNGRFMLSAFSADAKITFRRADGTAAAKTALRNGSIIARIAASGRGTTAWDNIPSASIVIRATEDWTSTAHGTGMDFATTQNGTLTPQVRMQIAGSGVVLMNTPEIGSDALQVGGGLKVWPGPRIGLLGTSPLFLTGATANVTAPAGSIFLRQPGAVGARVYVNQNGLNLWTPIAGV